MADPLSPLVEPPLAPPPPMGDLERRARGIQRRRWAVRGTGATAALVALIAGLVSFTGGQPRTTLRTAAPPPTTAPTAAAAPHQNLALDSFEAGGKTWQLIGHAESGGVCLLVQSGPDVANGLCWPDTSKLAVTSADVGGGTYLFGIAAPEVTLLSYGPNRPDDLVPFVGPNPSPFTAKIFGKLMPVDVASVTLTAATATDPQAYSQPVTLPLHRRVASVNGQLVPPTTASHDGLTVTPAHPGNTEPRPPATSPTVTTTPGQLPFPSKRVQPNAAASNLRPTRFQSAVGGDTSVTVRFWGGNETCDVLGRVDLQETSTTVTIRLWTGWPPGYDGGACTTEALLKEVQVSLSSPLAGRTIVDGNA